MIRLPCFLSVLSLRASAPRAARAAAASLAARAGPPPPPPRVSSRGAACAEHAGTAGAAHFEFLANAWRAGDAPGAGCVSLAVAENPAAAARWLPFLRDGAARAFSDADGGADGGADGRDGGESGGGDDAGPSALLYPSSYAGTEAFRAALCELLERELMQGDESGGGESGGARALDPESVVALAGATAAVDALCWALLEPGDAVLTPAPCYPR